jgi:molybdate transport system substrate-binding protein
MVHIARLLAVFWIGMGLSGAAFAAELTVSAAASLTNAFKELAQHYEARYPNTRVHLNFGASGALLQQMAKGAPVDVFASADQETMTRAVANNLVNPSDRRDFARNALVVVVPADSTLALSRLDDLMRPQVQRVAFGVPASVPVGRYAQIALQGAQMWTGIQPKLVNTQNVRQSLDYVARGEVDAGFVYQTDAMAMQDKVKVALTVPLPDPISYPIARTATTAQAQEAMRFVDYVLSGDGQKVLARYGFLKP